MRYTLPLLILVAVLSYLVFFGNTEPDAAQQPRAAFSSANARPTASDNVQGLLPNDRSYRIYD